MKSRKYWTWAGVTWYHPFQSVWNFLFKMIVASLWCAVFFDWKQTCILFGILPLAWAFACVIASKVKM